MKADAANQYFHVYIKSRTGGFGRCSVSMMVGPSCYGNLRSVPSQQPVGGKRSSGVRRGRPVQSCNGMSLSQ